MGQSVGYLVFAAGQALFGLPAEQSSGVVTVPTLTRVPGASAHILGLFALRGEVIPVVDFPALLGLVVPAAVDQSLRRAIIFRVDRGCAALTTSQVLGVMDVSFDAVSKGDSGIGMHLKGPGVSRAGEVTVIDPEGLFGYLCAGLS